MREKLPELTLLCIDVHMSEVINKYFYLLYSPQLHVQLNEKVIATTTNHSRSLYRRKIVCLACMQRSVYYKKKRALLSMGTGVHKQTLWQMAKAKFPCFISAKTQGRPLNTTCQSGRRQFEWNDISQKYIHLFILFNLLLWRQKSLLVRLGSWGWTNPWRLLQ